jgi:hypothetical protein
MLALIQTKHLITHRFHILKLRRLNPDRLLPEQAIQVILVYA